MSSILPFPVRSRLTPQEREAMRDDPLGEELASALRLDNFHFKSPEFLKALSQEQRERMEQTL